MSLVLDALEKAQKESQNKQTQNIPIYNAAPTEAINKKMALSAAALKAGRRPSIAPKIFLYSLAFCAIIAGIVYLANDFDTPEEPALSIKPIVPAIPKNFLSKEIPDQKPAAVRIPSLKLTGIMWDAKDPIAIINGKLMHQGDDILGVKILNIQLDKITAGYNGKEFTLTVE